MNGSDDEPPLDSKLFSESFSSLLETSKHALRKRLLTITQSNYIAFLTEVLWEVFQFVLLLSLHLIPLLIEPVEIEGLHYPPVCMHFNCSITSSQKACN